MRWEKMEALIEILVIAVIVSIFHWIDRRY